MPIYNNPYDELRENKKRLAIESLFQAASLAQKNKQLNSESQYYKNIGAYYSAAAKQQQMLNDMAEQERANQYFGGGLQIPPVGATPPQYAVPQFGQLSPEELMRQNNLNGVASKAQPNMVVKSMTVDPIKQTISQTYGQSPEAESDLQVKTQLRKDTLGRMGKLQELLPLLDNFETQLDSIPVGSGISGKAAGIKAQLLGMSNQDPFAAATMSQLNALRPQIARAFGDVGNLSKTEQETAKQFMPDVSDSKDTRAVKIVSGLGFLKRKLETAARDSGIIDSPEYQKKFSILNERIRVSLKKALDSGVSGKKLAKFAGADILKSLSVGKFKSESALEKVNPESGLVEIDGELGYWERNK